MIRVGWAAVLTTLFVVNAAWGREIFVNNVMGSDSNYGAAPEPAGRGGGPVRTIGRALKLANAGDVVIVANTGEPYRECLTLEGLQHSGILGFEFTIEGNGALLDGTQPVPPGAWEVSHDDVVRFRPERMAHQQLYLDGVPARRRLPLPDGALPALRPLEWCLLGGYIYFRMQDGALPEDYDLAYAVERAGLTLYQVEHVVIKDLVVQGYQLDGVNAHDGVRRTALVGLTSRGNGRAGIAIGGACQVQVEACLVGNNGAAQVLVEDHARVQIVRSDLLGNTAPPLVSEGGIVEVIDPVQSEAAPETPPAPQD